ncbi:hypothetical protein R1flu_000450 [Riccia fluitans]|uniref:pectinesterase n=1 Tax=Riccia fluitans TaxID=41844 RepID=A0ABD1Y0I6_9MARC
MLDLIDRMGEKHDSKVDGNTTELNLAATTTTPAPVIIVVDKHGKGNFKTINKAINAIPQGSKRRYIIRVNPGTYKELVKIPQEKGPITLQGSGARKTKITYNLDADKPGGSTLKSASVSIKSDYFIAKDISFENTSPSPDPGAVGKQAVALEISDFIFGNGHSYYEDCTLESVAKTFGSLAAQKRLSKSEDTGYSFVDCKVKGTGYLYLSRAWGPYSRVVFIRTYFADIIRPEGWYNWGVPGREKTVFYGEYKCFGPGANRKGREVWSYELSDKQVKPFLTVDWIDGKDWLPKGKQ